MAIRSHWFVCLVGIIAIPHWLPSTSLAQRNEASEMPEDCDQTQQYFDQMESKCRNCSEVMRLLEVGTNQDWQPANIDAVTFDTPASVERPPLTGDRGQDLRSRTEIISSVIGSRLTPLLPTGNSPLTPRRPLSPLKPSEALLSRLVMGPQPNSPDPSPPASQDNDDEEAGQTDPFAGLQDVNPGGSNLRQLDGSFNQLRHEQSTDLLRTAKRWQALLFGFLQSNEVAQSGLLDAIERCRSSQNMSACQMWSNMCVLTMYSHSDSSPSSSSFSKRPASLSRILRRPTSTSGRSREDKLWRRPTRFKTSWQHCPKFSLPSICNGLRDWHRLERQNSLSELGDIYADDQAEGPRPNSIQSSPLKLNQQIQLLAYEYTFDGRLLKVSQFNLHDLGELCLFAPTGALPAHLGGDLSSSENLLQQDEPKTMRNVRDILESERHIRVGQNMALSCRFSEFQANLLAPTHLNQTKFIDLFVGYQANGAAFVKPVPILLKNLQYQGQLVNLKYAKDSSRWRFVHRFFPFATLKLAGSSEEEDDQDEVASRHRVPDDGRDDQDGAVPPGRNNEHDANQDHELLLFARSANLEMKFKKQQDKGLVISSMLLVIDYDYLELNRRSRKSANNSTSTKAARDGAHPEVFESHIRLSQTLVDMHAYAKDLDLFVTILCIASSIWCLIKCYNIQKYHGLIKLDIHALLLFSIVACDVVANLLGLVVFAMALFLFASLKWQLFGLHQLVLAPNDNLEQSLLLKLKLALSMKLAGFFYKSALRFRVDLFFIDWEKPKMLTSSQIMSYQQQRVLLTNSATKRDDAKSAHPMSNLLHNQQQAQQQISFWRPYTIINRWLQMQTLRRQNLTVQLLAFLGSMQLTNLHRWATADPTLERDHPLELTNSNPLEPRLLANQSATFRALILALVYLALAILQVAYKKCFYEPMIKCSVREFIDLCSVANVSLFSMLHPRFGFYVHGRNPNGSGDCGITEMNVLLEREARDLCSKRGLQPNSDQQTFVLILPKIINDHYRKLLFRTDYAQMGAASPVFSADKFHLQHQQPAEFIKSALSLSGSLAPAGAASSSPGQGHPLSAGSKRVLIDNVVARNKAINSFLINFLEHAYREIDYSVRERRRFEGLLIEFDPNEADDDLLQRPTKLPPPRGARDLAGPTTALSHRAGGLGEATADAQPAATFFTDTQNSFASLLWLGLEWDLILIELLLLLNLDLWLGQESLILTSGLVWLINKLFKSVYCILARKNLITKSMLDEKLLIR